MSKIKAIDTWLHHNEEEDIKIKYKWDIFSNPIYTNLKCPICHSGVAFDPDDKIYACLACCYILKKEE